MTEGTAGITVSLVWAESDWPDGAPVQARARRVAALPVAAPQQTVFENRVLLPAAARIEEALQPLLTEAAQARIAQRRAHVAVYGRRMRPGMTLFDGDRIELLGPISAEPRQARMRRVSAERAEGADSRWRGRR